MPDGNDKTAQNALPGGQPSGTQSSSPPTGNANPQIAELEAKHQREIKAMAGRVKAAEERMATYERERDEAELAKVKDNPDKLTEWQRNRQLREREATLAQKEAELKAEEDEVRHYRAFKIAKEIAANYKDLDPEELASLTDGSKERMETLAERIGKPKEKPKSEEESKPQQPAPKLDSGATIGGVGKLTVEQADKMSIEEYAERRKKEGAPFR